MTLHLAPCPMKPPRLSMIPGDVCVNTNVFPVNLTNEMRVNFQYLDYMHMQVMFAPFRRRLACDHDMLVMRHWPPPWEHFIFSWERFIHPPPTHRRSPRQGQSSAGSAAEQNSTARLALLKIHCIAQGHFSRAGATVLFHALKRTTRLQCAFMLIRLYGAVTKSQQVKEE